MEHYDCECCFYEVIPIFAFLSSTKIIFRRMDFQIFISVKLMIAVSLVTNLDFL